MHLAGDWERRERLDFVDVLHKSCLLDAVQIVVGHSGLALRIELEPGDCVVDARDYPSAVNQAGAGALVIDRRARAVYRPVSLVAHAVLTRNGDLVGVRHLFG